MGCNMSHCCKSKDAVQPASMRPMDAKKPHAGSPRTMPSLRDANGQVPSIPEVGSLNDYDITFADLIGERSGRIADHFELLDPPLGKGAFGEVRRAVHKKAPEIVRAVKVIYKDLTDKSVLQTLIKEVNVLKGLDHPNIMKVFGYFHDEKHLYILSEYLEGGELFDKILKMKTFTERHAAETMKQILSAVSYCHAHNVVHRDIKPDNLLYESKSDGSLLKLIDFGESKVWNHLAPMHRQFGTCYYIAPEVLKGNYNEKCDIWSCGVILYLLLSGYPPFNADEEDEILRKVEIGRYEFDSPEWDGISQEAKNLIKRMLEYNPQKRCSAAEALNDPWFEHVLGKPHLDLPLAATTLNKLKSFRAERKLQYATWVLLVTYMTGREEKYQLLETFKALDLNGDGQLSRDELLKGYREILNHDNGDAEAEVEAIMKAVDIDHSGTIDYTEFVIAAMNRQKVLRKDRLDALFKYIDKDNCGYITAAHLNEVFNSGKRHTVSQATWDEMIREFDENQDGKLSEKEFQHMMNKLI